MNLADMPHAGRRCILDDEFVPPHAGGRLCAWHVIPLAMVCYGKERRSRESATVSIRRRIARGAGPNRAYRCPICSTWHVGAYDPARPDGTIKAGEIVKELRGAGFGWYVGQLAEDWHPRHVTRDQNKVWRGRLTA